MPKDCTPGLLFAVQEAVGWILSPMHWKSLLEGLEQVLPVGVKDMSSLMRVCQQRLYRWSSMSQRSDLWLDPGNKVTVNGGPGLWGGTARVDARMLRPRN